MHPENLSTVFTNTLDDRYPGTLGVISGDRYNILGLSDVDNENMDLYEQIVTSHNIYILLMKHFF